MSYCHASTPKVLQFHPIVEQNALIPSMSAALVMGLAGDGHHPNAPSRTFKLAFSKHATPLTLTYRNRSSFRTNMRLQVDGLSSMACKLPLATAHNLSTSWEAADGQNVNVSAYFTTNEGCALSKANAFTHRDPCCGQFRITYIDHDANIVHVRNEADCPGQLDEWGFLTPDGFTQLTDLVSQGQNLVVDPGRLYRFRGRQASRTIGSCCFCRLTSPTITFNGDRKLRPTSISCSMTNSTSYGLVAEARLLTPFHPIPTLVGNMA